MNEPRIDSISGDIKINFEFTCSICGKTMISPIKRVIVMRTSPERFLEAARSTKAASADMPIGWACRGDYSFICAKCVGKERDK